MVIRCGACSSADAFALDRAHRRHCLACGAIVSALPPTPPLAALLGHAARSEHALPQQRSRVPSLSWVLAMPLCLDVPARAVAPAGAPRRARQIAAALLALAGVATVAWLLRP